MRAQTTVVLAAVLMTAAACTDSSLTTSPSATPSTPGASRASGGPVASCVTGNWRSTEVNAAGRNGSASASLTGGSGVAVSVGANGETDIDFAKMQPVEFSTKVAGSDFSGRFTFAGQVSALVQTGPATSTPSPALTGTASASPSASPSTSDEGRWEPVPPVSWGDTRVTVDLTAPVKARPVDNIRIADYVGDGAKQTGNVVDIEPLLGEGRYQCAGDNLILTPDDGGIAWTLTRA
jgi:hypothetical protein